MTYDEAIEAKNRLSDKLLALPRVQGVGVTKNKQTGEFLLLVFVVDGFAFSNEFHALVNEVDYQVTGMAGPFTTFGASS